MNSPLFRPQAVAAQAGPMLGAIRIGQRPRHLLVAAVALGLTVALVALATWGEITRKVRVPGHLLPAGGIVQLVAPAGGVVKAVLAAPGDVVAAGGLIFDIVTDRASDQGATADLVAEGIAQRRMALQAEMTLRQAAAVQRQQALADRLRALQTEAERAAEEVDLTRRRAEIAGRHAERARQLA